MNAQDEVIMSVSHVPKTRVAAAISPFTISALASNLPMSYDHELKQ